MKTTPQKDKILEAVLRNIPFDGWTQDAVNQAIEADEFTAKDWQTEFSGSLDKLVAYFGDYTDQKMLEQIDHEAFKDMRVRDKIAYLVRLRLEICEPHKEAIKTGVKFFMRPDRAIKVPQYFWRTADLMWYEAGDTATDYNHYSKRFLLSGVLKSTLLYWLNDKSENHEKTWVFLDNRINDVLKIGGTIGKFINFAEKFNPFVKKEAS
ncbi:MAG: COQ9 family protein [Rickettsiales bacterium]|nr:COQ9 family protein [Rickettsiales bacterium]|tara:strand:- start:943 stop:1566 length:624 start_codon:yes stop_codon:yes gene_type:complete